MGSTAIKRVTQREFFEKAAAGAAISYGPRGVFKAAALGIETSTKSLGLFLERLSRVLPAQAYETLTREVRVANLREDRAKYDIDPAPR